MKIKNLYKVITIINRYNIKIIISKAKEKKQILLKIIINTHIIKINYKIYNKKIYQILVNNKQKN